MKPFIGSIQLVGFSYAPQNWAFCNGQLLPIKGNELLYALLGANYGGDGVNNFGLPKLNAGNLQEGLNYIICLVGLFPPR
jgi:microcystin-dependent protein